MYLPLDVVVVTTQSLTRSLEERHKHKYGQHLWMARTAHGPACMHALAHARTSSRWPARLLAARQPCEHPASSLRALPGRTTCTPTMRTLSAARACKPTCVHSSARSPPACVPQHAQQPTPTRPLACQQT